VRDVTVRFAPDGLYRAALLGGGLLLAVLAVVALTPAARLLTRRRGGAARSSEPPPVGARALPRPALLVGAALALGVVAGWVGVLTGAGAALVTWGATSLVRSRTGPRESGRTTELLVAALGTAPLGVAVVVAALRPWGSDAGWSGALLLPQVLAVWTVAALLVVDPDTPDRSSLKRSAGRSTSR
jgi:hypothetical protein